MQRDEYTLEIENENRRKYLKPPTIARILKVIEDAGVSFAHFELYYAMTPGTIKNVKGGFKKMPVRYWAIFYDPKFEEGKRGAKVVPTKVPIKINEDDRLSGV